MLRVDLHLESDGNVRLGELGNRRADKMAAFEAEAITRGSGSGCGAVAKQRGSCEGYSLISVCNVILSECLYITNTCLTFIGNRKK